VFTGLFCGRMLILMIVVIVATAQSKPTYQQKYPY